MPDSILHRVAKGDPAATRQLIDRYGGLVHALARRFLFDHSELDDAVQDVFVALWQSAGRFDPKIAAEETFVAMVARRRLIDRRRRAQRRTQGQVDAELSVIPEDHGPPSPEISEQARRAVDLIRTLRPEQQTVLRMSLCHGLSHEQIARLTGTPLGTVKTHVRRGLIALREAMKPFLAKQPDA